GSRLVPTVTVMLPATADWNVIVAVVDVVVTATFLNDALPGPLGGTTGTHAAKLGTGAKRGQPNSRGGQTRRGRERLLAVDMGGLRSDGAELILRNPRPDRVSNRCSFRRRGRVRTVRRRVSRASAR